MPESRVLKDVQLPGSEFQLPGAEFQLPGADDIMAQVPVAQIVERLTTTNYNVWALKTKHFLIKEALWEYVNDPPGDPTPADERQDEKALALIVLSVGDDQLIYVADKKSSQEAWNALKAVYLQTNIGSLISLTRKLYRKIQQPGESIKAHLNVLTGYFQQLQERGKDFAEDYKIFIILNSLGPRYDMLTTALETVDVKSLSLQHIVGRILQEEERFVESELRSKESGLSAKSSGHRSKEIPTDSASATCMFPAGASKQLHRDISSVALRVKKCFCCGSTNHLLRSCPEKKEQRRK